jgi:hypothetical protein
VMGKESMGTFFLLPVTVISDPFPPAITPPVPFICVCVCGGEATGKTHLPMLYTLEQNLPDATFLRQMD